MPCTDEHLVTHLVKELDLGALDPMVAPVAECIPKWIGEVRTRKSMYDDVTRFQDAILCRRSRTQRSSEAPIQGELGHTVSIRIKTDSASIKSFSQKLDLSKLEHVQLNAKFGQPRGLSCLEHRYQQRGGGAFVADSGGQQAFGMVLDCDDHLGHVWNVTVVPWCVEATAMDPRSFDHLEDYVHDNGDQYSWSARSDELDKCSWHCYALLQSSAGQRLRQSAG